MIMMTRPARLPYIMHGSRARSSYGAYKLGPLSRQGKLCSVCQRNMIGTAVAAVPHSHVTATHNQLAHHTCGQTPDTCYL
jgi:hypothetical protein